MGLRITAKNVNFTNFVSRIFSLLDISQPPILAVSVSRKLRREYSGPLIKVRRSSDNALRDIGFDDKGNLDEAALVSFLSGADGFIHTLYSQHSNFNFEQETATSQPQIAVNGEIYKVNNRPSMKFNGSQILNSKETTLLNNAKFAISLSVQSSRATADGRALFIPSATAIAIFRYTLAQRENTFRVTALATASVNNITRIIEKPCPQNQLFIFSTCLDYDNQTLSASLNGDLLDQVAMPTKITFDTVTPINKLSIGGELTQLESLVALTRGYKGDISEIIVYQNDIVDEIKKIEDDQKFYYSI